MPPESASRRRRSAWSCASRWWMPPRGVDPGAVRVLVNPGDPRYRGRRYGNRRLSVDSRLHGAGHTARLRPGRRPRPWRGGRTRSTRTRSKRGRSNTNWTTWTASCSSTVSADCAASAPGASSAVCGRPNRPSPAATETSASVGIGARSDGSDGPRHGVPARLREWGRKSDRSGEPGRDRRGQLLACDAQRRRDRSPWRRERVGARDRGLRRRRRRSLRPELRNFSFRRACCATRVTDRASSPNVEGDGDGSGPTPRGRHPPGTGSRPVGRRAPSSSPASTPSPTATAASTSAVRRPSTVLATRWP